MFLVKSYLHSILTHTLSLSKDTVVKYAVKKSNKM